MSAALAPTTCCLDAENASRTNVVIATRSPGVAIVRVALTRIGAGAAAAAFATTSCQNRSNDDTDGSRNRHASSAPLTITRPAPTGADHTIGCGDAPRVTATAVPPVGSVDGQLSS